ncbi:MAG: hypothetical protein ACM3UZ_13290 [Acidobacteriota bacterium]
MRCELDVSNDRFDHIGFDGATVFFQCYPSLGKTMEIKIWGLTLASGGQFFNEISGLSADIKGDSIYISGFTNVRFEDILGGFVNVWVYDYSIPDGQVLKFLRDLKGNTVILRRVWPYDVIECPKYLIGGSLDWPYGGCELELAVMGKVSIEFDTNDCISALQYLQNKDCYEYDANKCVPGDGSATR